MFIAKALDEPDKKESVESTKYDIHFFTCTYLQFLCVLFMDPDSGKKVGSGYETLLYCTLVR